MKRKSAGFRFDYRPYPPVLDVGFRIIVEEDRLDFPPAKVATDRATPRASLMTATATHAANAADSVHR